MLRAPVRTPAQRAARRALWPAIAIVAALPSVAGAGKSSPHDPKTFVEYSSADSFELPADAKYSERRGLGALIEQGLRAGKYIGQYQDKEGLYFLGEGAPVCQGNPRCRAFDLEGGVWVSKRDAADIRVFLIQPPPKAPKAEAAQGILADALGRKDTGKIFIFPANAAFAAQLAAYRRQ
jgi:hypothetical protein